MEGGVRSGDAWPDVQGRSRRAFGDRCIGRRRRDVIKGEFSLWMEEMSKPVKNVSAYI